MKPTTFIGLSLCAALWPGSAQGWNPPDTADLAATYKVSARELGKPSEWIQFQDIKKRHALHLRLRWQADQIIEARYEGKNPFESDDFADLMAQFGGGGSWHALPDAMPGGIEAKLFPGIIQQWWLDGFGDTHAWAGSGIWQDQFFMAFRKEPPVKPKQVEGPLGVFSENAPTTGNRSIGSPCQDTATGWLKITCPKDWAGLSKNAQCYSPDDQPRRWIAVSPAVQGKAHKTWWALWNDGDPLKDIADAMRNLPAGSEVAYSQDLSQIVFGEAQVFLAQVAQASPCIFNQPSWAFSHLSEGQIQPAQYQPFLGKKAQYPDWLPALNLKTPLCSLRVDIAWGGAYRMRLDSRP